MILCERRTVKAEKSREISNVCLHTVNIDFVTKCSANIQIIGLKPCTKFQIDIPLASCPIGLLKFYGNVTREKHISVTQIREETQGVDSNPDSDF